jgi:hypothetical protein
MAIENQSLPTGIPFALGLWGAITRQSPLQFSRFVVIEVIMRRELDISDVPGVAHPIPSR